MAMALVCFIGSVSAAQSAAACYGIRLNLSDQSQVALVDSVFDGCGTREAGGAIYIVNSITDLSVLDCAFIRCQGRYGACIDCQVKLVEIFRFSGTDCSSIGAAFCNMYVASSETGTIELNQSAATAGNCSDSSFYTQFTTRVAGRRQIVQTHNSTANLASRWGASLNLDWRYSLLMQFCRFASNFFGNTLCLGTSYSPDTVRCLDFFNNTVVSGTDWPGLIAIRVSCEFHASIFVANSIDYFLGTYLSDSNQFSGVFIGCVFDNSLMEIAGSAVLSTSSCVIDSVGTISPDLVQCPLSTPPPSPPMPSESSTADFSVGDIARAYHSRRVFFHCALFVVVMKA
jgi:hypothetical protein